MNNMILMNYWQVFVKRKNSKEEQEASVSLPLIL